MPIQKIGSRTVSVSTSRISSNYSKTRINGGSRLDVGSCLSWYCLLGFHLSQLRAEREPFHHTSIFSINPKGGNSGRPGVILIHSNSYSTGRGVPKRSKRSR